MIKKGNKRKCCKRVKIDYDKDKIIKTRLPAIKTLDAKFWGGEGTSPPSPHPGSAPEIL